MAEATTLSYIASIDREIRELSERLKRAQEKREERLAEVLEAGITKEERPWGTYRLVVKPGRITRVLDVEAFKAAFPKAYRKVVQTSVRLADAEREVGKANLGTVVSIREGTATAAIEFEPTAMAFAKEAIEP